MTTLTFTVDVDGEAGLPDGGVGFERLLTSRSERAYGIACGLPRILALLDEFEITATFYVPGVTAVRHPAEIAALAAGRHEIGHHGHLHQRPDLLSAEEQRRDVLLGLEALTSVTGRRPSGYRAPGWELTTQTLEQLLAESFAFDSSLMGADTPYRLSHDGRSLIELPVHWSLDDAPHFAAQTGWHALRDVWVEELSAAAREGRHLTYTVHPEIAGRPHRLELLRRLFDEAGRLGARWVTHGAVAGSFDDA